MKRIPCALSLLLILGLVLPVSACSRDDRHGTVKLDLYAVNDLHGKFMDTDGQPGVDEFTTYMKNAYADPSAEEILLSSGDMWQGTVESSSNRGSLMTEWMNEAGFTSMTLGNHEFDWGPNALQKNSKSASFPLLAINVMYNGQPASYCKPSVVIEKGGLKVGIIGAIGDCLSSISGEFQEGLEFKVGGDLTALVKEESTRLRKKEGCDFIVYSIHDGGSGFRTTGVNSVTNQDIPYYDTALSKGYVDLVFEAHTHKQYILKDEHGIYHLQGGGENKGVSYASVSYNFDRGTYSVTPKILDPEVYADGSLKDDPSVKTIFQKYFADSNPYETVLGRNASSRNSTAILNTVAKLYYEKGVEQWGGQYTISAGGGYLNARSPYRVSQGDVTYADLYSVLPFDNELVLGKLSGADFKSFLNRRTDSSHKYTIYTTIEAVEVDLSKEYYVIVDTYTSTYRSNHITEVARLPKSMYARDLLAEYIQAGNWR